MSGAVHQPRQVQDDHQSKQETHEKPVPQSFAPEDVRNDHRHDHGQNGEQYFIVSEERKREKDNKKKKTII